MNEKILFDASQVCENLGVSLVTLNNWYSWEKKLLKQGNERYLPVPIRLERTKGKPRMWDLEMIEELKKYKHNIVTGRNGVYGKFSNPYHKETKKYKNLHETLTE